MRESQQPLRAGDVGAAPANWVPIFPSSASAPGDAPSGGPATEGHLVDHDEWQRHRRQQWQLYLQQQQQQQHQQPQQFQVQQFQRRPDAVPSQDRPGAGPTSDAVPPPLSRAAPAPTLPPDAIVPFDPFNPIGSERGLPIYASPLTELDPAVVAACWRMPPATVLGFEHADEAGRPYRPDDLPNISTTIIDGQGRERSVGVVVFRPDAPCVDYNTWWELGQPTPVFQTFNGVLIFTKNFLVKQTPLPVPRAYRQHPLAFFELVILMQYAAITMGAVALFSGNGGGALAAVSQGRAGACPRVFLVGIFMWITKVIADLVCSVLPAGMYLPVAVARCMQSSTPSYRIVKSFKWATYMYVRMFTGQVFLLFRRKLAFALWGAYRHKDGSVTLHPAFLAFELLLQLYITASLLAFAVTANGSLQMWMIVVKAVLKLGAAHGNSARLLFSR